MLSSVIWVIKKSPSSARFRTKAPFSQGSCGCVCRGDWPGRAHGLLAWKTCAKGMVKGKGTAQSLRPQLAVGGEMLPGQRLLQPCCYRSSNTHVQTAVPHTMKAAEGGQTSLLATSSAWQGKPDPCTLVSTMHTPSSSPRAHTHHPQPHRRICPHAAAPTRTHKEQKSGWTSGHSHSLRCPPRVGEKEQALPGDTPHRLPLQRVRLVNSSKSLGEILGMG